MIAAPHFIINTRLQPGGGVWWRSPNRFSGFRQGVEAVETVYVFIAQRRLVAQICNLPYRRFIIGRASESSSALALADLPQNAILRYSRLQICATLKTYETVLRLRPAQNTPLKRGVNEKNPLRMAMFVKHSS
jgi:hypothetical protein